MSLAVLDAERAVEGETGRRVKLSLAGLNSLMEDAARAQQGRTLLWAAPALAAGIGLYFALPAEPGLALAIAAAMFGGVLLWLGRAAPLVRLIGIAALGFALAKGQGGLGAGPILSASTAEVAVTARVVSIERASRARLMMVAAPDVIEGIPTAKTPARLRLSLLEKSGHPAAGDRIAFKARLAPLPSPVEPGGFDYGRKLWFDGIGGTGRVTSDVTILDHAVPWTGWLESWLRDIRAAMGLRIRAVLAEPYASFAEALITGERSTIPPEINRSLLISGLYHILSISGLHMWLVAGGIFWAVRAALALVPGLALGFPIRKWAAAAALVMALFYMLLADSGVATTRSFVMVAIVFFAMMVDRPAVSVRNLALAALVVMVLDPKAAVEASFQMSFLAVLGLVAWYEAWARYKLGRGEGEQTPRRWPARIAIWAAAAFAASIVTSLIAGFSSSVPAAYHFGRISPYGVLANGLAIPVMGFLVMPEALMAAVLMPLGLDALPLYIMGKGLQLVILISNFVASLPGANEVIARPPALPMVAIAAGMVMLCLLRGPVRAAGVAVMGMGALLLAIPHPAPDILIEARGQNVVLRDAHGLLVPAQPRRGRFAVGKWLQSDGDEASPADAAKRTAWHCAENRCTAEVKGRRILYLSRAEGEAFDCTGIQILIADFPLRSACRAVPLRIDRFDLWRKGAHAIRFEGATPVIETARGLQGERPWTVKPEARPRPRLARD